MKRQRRGLLPSFDSPCRCAGSIFFAAGRHLRQGGSAVAAPVFPAGDGRAKTLSSVCEDGRITHSGAAVPVLRGGRDVEGAVPYMRNPVGRAFRGGGCRSTLPQMPFAALSQRARARKAARLRRLRPAFFCPRQRQAAIPCEESRSMADSFQVCTTEGRFLRGGIPLLRRFN